MVEEKSFALLDIEGRLAALEDALLKQDPLLPQHLGNIHRALTENEELVHLLSDEQVRTLIRAQKKHVGVMLVKEITTKRASTAKVPKASADDF